MMVFMVETTTETRETNCMGALAFRVEANGKTVSTHRTRRAAIVAACDRRRADVTVRVIDNATGDCVLYG